MSRERLNDNNVIAKNTIYLYIRMIIVLLVTLYTSRITLQILGFESYGLYTVVAGFISMFASLINMMTGATQRFITIALGRGSKNNLQNIFSQSIIIHGCISIIFLLLSETIGLWYLQNKLVIPSNYEFAAFWVYQFAVLSTMVTITQVPYNSLIIAYEKMKIFALASLVEVILKLGFTFLLIFLENSLNILVLYSILMFLSTLFIRVFYLIYSFNYIPESRFKLYWDGQLMKEMLGFSCWSMFGTVSYLAINQSIPIILNRFFGVIINSAMGIANQVSGTVNALVSNFQMAFKPQIIKLYAKNEIDEMVRLVFLSSKFSFIIIFIGAYPLILCIDYVLHIWLGNVPAYTSTFCILTLVYCLLDSLVIPLWTTIEATGKIKIYQLVVGLFFLLYIPISYFLLSFGYSPGSILILKILMSIFIHAMRVYIVSYLINSFSVKNYFENVLFPIVTCCLFPVLLALWKRPVIDSFILFLGSFIAYFSVSLLSCFFIALNRRERNLIISVVKNKLTHGKN